MKRLAIVMLLSGCATTAHDISYEIKQERQAIDDDCRQAMQAQTLETIRTKVPTLQNLDQPTLVHLSDQSFATDEQRPAILVLDSVVIGCANRRMHLAAKYFGSDYAAVVNAASSDAQSNRLELYLGKVSWGQYVAKSHSISTEARGMLAELDQRRRQMDIHKQTANAQSAGAAAAMLQATRPVFQPIQPLTLQPLPPLPRPINCTSIRQGAFTSTNCQ